MARPPDKWNDFTETSNALGELWCNITSASRIASCVETLYRNITMLSLKMAHPLHKHWGWLAHLINETILPKHPMHSASRSATLFRRDVYIGHHVLKHYRNINMLSLRMARPPYEHLACPPNKWNDFIGADAQQMWELGPGSYWCTARCECITTN